MRVKCISVILALVVGHITVTESQPPETRNCNWLGESPFCGHPTCSAGWHQAARDKHGDGHRCLTGKKVLCCEDDLPTTTTTTTTRRPETIPPTLRTTSYPRPTSPAATTPWTYPRPTVSSTPATPSPWAYPRPPILPVTPATPAPWTYPIYPTPPPTPAPGTYPEDDDDGPPGSPYGWRGRNVHPIPIAIERPDIVKPKPVTTTTTTTTTTTPKPKGSAATIREKAILDLLSSIDK